MVKLSRREFLKLTGITALLASLDWDKLIEAAAKEVSSGTINVIWFEAQDCAGDTTALLEATRPSIVSVLVGASPLGPKALRLVYHETIMLSWGEKTPEYIRKLLSMTPSELEAYISRIPSSDPLRKQLEKLVELGYTPGLLLSSPIDILKMAEEGKLDPYILVLEGSIPIDDEAGAPSGSTMFCFIGEENGKPISCLEWMRRLLKRAVAVVAVGNCACYGGLVADRVLESEFMERMGYNWFKTWSSRGWSYSPTGAVGFFPDKRRGHKGLVDLLPEAKPFRRFAYSECSLEPGEIRSDCRPAIAVPGCPANGDAQVMVLANVILWAKGVLPLPELDEFWRPKFIFGLRVHDTCPRFPWYMAGEYRSYPGEPSPRCLYSVGCKGPIAHCPWNKVGWVNGVGGPVRTGGPCTGCTEPGFTDEFEPFYQKIPRSLFED